MTFETLLVETSDGLAIVTINRPDKLNALNADVIRDLDQCFKELETADAVRGVILTGAGDKAFVAGADIKQFSNLKQAEAIAFAKTGQAVFSRIENCPKPVVAAVNGYALGGGCELALACHLRVASKNAVFGQPEVNLGVIPGYGGTQRLPRVVGSGIATEMILTGKPVTADRAFEIGLANKVVESDDLMEAAKKLISSITSKAPLAVAYALGALAAAAGDGTSGMNTEAELFGKAFATEDVKEGVSAFLERRKPVFSGR